MIKAMNVSCWVERWSELQPDKPALICQDIEVTYAELHRRAQAVAYWLQDKGLEKGDRVAVLLDNCPEFIELYLACARLGIIFVPLNPRLAPPEIYYLLSNCRPRLFIFKDTVAKVTSLDFTAFRPPLQAAAVGEPGDSQSIDDYWGDTRKCEGKNPFLTPSLTPSLPEDPQVIMYTSEAFGSPKGAVLTYAKTFFNCLNTEMFFQMAFDDVMLCLLPMYHAAGLYIQASPTLYKGATLVLHSRFALAEIFKDIAEHKVTKFLGLPTIYNQIKAVPLDKRGDLSSMRVWAVSAGLERITPDFLSECREAGISLRQVLGRAETSILFWTSEDDSLQHPGSVGKPVFHAEVSLLDLEGKPVARGQLGEIAVRGPEVVKEYWRDPQRSQEAFRGDWFLTGDMARCDEWGYFHLLERERNQFISGGEIVHPAEIELVLKSHPQVLDAMVVAEDDQTLGQAAHAFLAVKPGANLETDDILEFCRRQLASFKLPQRVTVCGKLPQAAEDDINRFLPLQEPAECEL